MHCHQRGGECSDPAPRGEEHTRPLPHCRRREIKSLGSILSSKRAWKQKAGALPRMLHPHSPGEIKGFPHSVQRKSETPQGEHPLAPAPPTAQLPSGLQPAGRPPPPKAVRSPAPLASVKPQLGQLGNLCSAERVAQAVEILS